MPDQENRAISLYRSPARVLGCLTPNTITVVVLPDNGMADGGVPTQLPVEMVPPELRMPNSVFDLWYSPNDHAYTQVLRKDEPDPQAQTT